jgi:hypothetical protein
MVENNQCDTNLKNLGDLRYKKIWRERVDEQNATASKQPSMDLKKWATFTYYGKEVNHIRKLVKNTNVQIQYNT